MHAVMASMTQMVMAVMRIVTKQLRFMKDLLRLSILVYSYYPKLDVP